MNEWLKDEVTMSGSINISLAPKEYERICKKELKMLYTLYPDTAKKEFTILPWELFHTPLFKEKRQIKFPDCVLSVTKFIDMNRRNFFFGFRDTDFSWNKLFSTGLFVDGVFDMSVLTSRMVTWSVIDQLKLFSLEDIKHEWNYTDHTLLITGHLPYNSVYCELFTKVPDNLLYDDPWVQKWMSAKAKLNVAKTIGTFQATLIGSVQVNTSLYTEEANRDIEECKEYFKNLVNADQFFITTP